MAGIEELAQHRLVDALQKGGCSGLRHQQQPLPKLQLQLTTGHPSPTAAANIPNHAHRL